LFPGLADSAVGQHLSDRIGRLLHAVELDVAIAVKQFWSRDTGQRLRLLQGLARLGNQRDVAVAAGYMWNLL
jgi:hypothetical protein